MDLKLKNKNKNKDNGKDNKKEQLVDSMELKDLKILKLVERWYDYNIQNKEGEPLNDFIKYINKTTEHSLTTQKRIEKIFVKAEKGDYLKLLFVKNVIIKEYYLKLKDYLSKVA
jgi:hypothetical protein